MNKALIIIDYVNDFVAEDGALSCGAPAQAIDGAMAALARGFINDGGLVVVANDCHAPNDAFHPESKLFPPHCLAGSRGAELYGETKAAVDGSNAVRLDKSRYSAFAGTCLDILLRERGITELHLAGVCTDICVLHTAVDAYNLGYKITVRKNCVASFNQAGHEFALAHMKNTIGAEIMD